MFEVQNLYRVDRATRANAAGLGNADRNGQYFFPPHTEQRTYGLWDPFYTGPRVATYHHTEQLDGLTVYVFNFIAEDLDETAGYVSLPDVPEKYRASTDGRGKIWVEPLTGIAVDFEEAGTSYFIESATGRRVAEIFEWRDRYTPETRAAQVQLAKQLRLRYLALDYGVPFALIAAGIIWVVAAVYDRGRHQTNNASSPFGHRRSRAEVLT